MDLAERVGFEPTVPVKAQRFSSSKAAMLGCVIVCRIYRFSADLASGRSG